MRRAAVAGIAALSIAGGSVAIAAVVPVATALAQDSGATTTTAPGSSATVPTPRAPKAERPGAGRTRDGILGSLVTDGTITQEQADKIKARFGEAATKARAGLAEKRDAVREKFGAKVEEIATFLGISAEDLRTQLKTKSLGEIAGHKKPELVTFLTDAVNKRVDEAVAGGRITQEQADKIKAETADRITKLVDVVGGRDRAGKLGGFRPKGPRR